MKEKPEKPTKSEILWSRKFLWNFLGIKDFLGHENSMNFRWKEFEISIVDLNNMDLEDK